MKKRILSILLMLFMVFGSCGFNVFAAEDEPTWQLETPMPTARYRVQAVAVGDKIYALGGAYAGDNYLTTVEIYDTKSGTWSTGEPIPQRIYNYGAAAVGDDIYVVGGSEEVNGTLTNTVYIYSTTSDTWRTGTPMPTARYNFCTATVGDKLYAIGGGKSERKVEIYDTKTDTWSTGTPNPVVICNPGTGTVGNKIYSQTGVSGTGSYRIYDIETDTWSAGAASPYSIPLLTVSSATVEDKIYLIGSGNKEDEVCIYNTSEDSWTQGTPMDQAIRYAGVAYVNGKIYRIGGASGGIVLNTVLSLEVPLDSPTPDPTPTNTLSVLLEVDETVQLSVTKNLSDNEDFIWTSDDLAVAVVDADGEVTAISEGLTKITAENADGTFKESINVRVVPKDEADELRLAVDLRTGQSVRLYLNDDEDIIWTSLDPSIATVDANGKVTAVSRGLAIVQAESGDVTEIIYVRVR